MCILQLINCEAGFLGNFRFKISAINVYCACDGKKNVLFLVFKPKFFKKIRLTTFDKKWSVGAENLQESIGATHRVVAPLSQKMDSVQN